LLGAYKGLKPRAELTNRIKAHRLLGAYKGLKPYSEEFFYQAHFVC